ncbi:MAG TPA: SRPBCC family protein [Ktedonobacterales bacterium]
MPSRAAIVGAAITGASAMYLFDPDRGTRRRALLRDQVIHLTHRASDGLDTANRDLANRARGWLALLGAADGDAPVPESVLVARVRARLGRAVSHPAAIAVTATDGRVTLSGPILAHEAERLLAAVGRVRGVRDVENQLQPRQSAGNEPALQGRSPRRGVGLPTLQTSWPPAARLASIVGGSGVLLTGLTRRSPWGPLLALTGAGLLARGITNRPLACLLGISDDGRGAVQLHKSLLVHAPVERVFAIWDHPENFPRFMGHVREVRRLSPERSHWVVEGPAGTRVQWEAILARREPNSLLAWHTVPGSPIAHAGIARFQPSGENATRLDLQLSYTPPAGALGHTIATLLGADPKRELEEDLVRFKSLVEMGKTRAHGHLVAREELTTTEAATSEQVGSVGG